MDKPQRKRRKGPASDARAGDPKKPNGKKNPVDAAAKARRKAELEYKLKLILESEYGPLVADVIEMLYQRHVRSRAQADASRPPPGNGHSSP
jgi:hypothetical protein